MAAGMNRAHEFLARELRDEDSVPDLAWLAALPDSACTSRTGSNVNRFMREGEVAAYLWFYAQPRAGAWCRPFQPATEAPVWFPSPTPRAERDAGRTRSRHPRSQHSRPYPARHLAGCHCAGGGDLETRRAVLPSVRVPWEYERVGTVPAQVSQGTFWRAGQLGGCPHCPGSGYLGRTPMMRQAA
jgi:hypothetical protein